MFKHFNTFNVCWVYFSFKLTDDLFCNTINTTYFNDDVFARLLQKVYTWCAPGGEIVIGNFSLANPNRSYMERGAEWYLHHRSDEELVTLAMRSGISQDQVYVSSESLGVNLFLHMRA